MTMEWRQTDAYAGSASNSSSLSVQHGKLLSTLKSWLLLQRTKQIRKCLFIKLSNFSVHCHELGIRPKAFGFSFVSLFVILFNKYHSTHLYHEINTFLCFLPIIWFSVILPHKNFAILKFPNTFCSGVSTGHI